jgi:conjugal transfer pilus assembly protein TraL
MGNSDTYIFNRLDDPWKLGMWELDVAFPFVACVFLGILRGSIISLSVGVLIGTFVSWRIAKLRASKHPGYALHMAYWHLPSIGRLNGFRCLPDSAIREMVG